MSYEDMTFVKEIIHDWIGNIMRDMEAQGKPLDLTDIATALETVAYEIDNPPPDWDEWLTDLGGIDDN